MTINFVFVLFSILCTVAFCIVQKDVKILQGNFAWEDGFDQPGCDLLGMEFINVDLGDVRVQDWSETREGSSRSNAYWIGAYVQYSKWIRLRGCFFVEVQILKSIVGNANIRECTRYCNGSNFGLTSERCVCFDTLVETNEKDYCRAAKCPNNVDEFCGNVIAGRRSCVCVYKRVNLISDNDIGNCKTVMLNRRNGELQTKDCSETHTFLCRGSGNNEVDLYRQEKNWTDAGFACSREYEKHFFSRLNDYRNVPYGQHWIGIFRKETFQWGNVMNRAEGFHCVSVTVNTDGRLQKFVTNCDSRLPLLCERSRNVNTGFFFPSKRITTTKSDALTTTTHMYSNDTSPDLNVQWLVLGLVGGVVITLAIVSITVVILRCRKKRIEAEAIVNQAGDPNYGANYDQLNHNRENNPYTELRNNSVIYDYISTTDTNRDYVEIIEG
ncbi:hypothetical protein KP79_PYT12467 [Mizuhopecten yessoensis]|uniref:WSC domain-containing protein n=1 Tax=Mizuhopecten yessoensis TaxID=6573 RepID=A0A210QJK4_MIZYE|nr:hypothetical protein KP79_PYT12467 [Mizuhopecten yessoensis]